MNALVLFSILFAFIYVWTVTIQILKTYHAVAIIFSVLQ